jgi:hypothetical protein
MFLSIGPEMDIPVPESTRCLLPSEINLLSSFLPYFHSFLSDANHLHHKQFLLIAFLQIQCFDQTALIISPTLGVVNFQIKIPSKQKNQT